MMGIILIIFDTVHNVLKNRPLNTYADIYIK